MDLDVPSHEHGISAIKKNQRIHVKNNYIHILNYTYNQYRERNID